MSMTSDRIPPLDRDGRSEMFWDDNMELYRSWTDPFWFCTRNGRFFYQCTSGGNGVSYMPHPRVWDYLVNGYEDQPRNGNEQIAFFAGNSEVRTQPVLEFALLELYLRSQGFDLTMYTFSQGVSLDDIAGAVGPSNHEIGSEPKVSFKPYEQARDEFDRSRQTFSEMAATAFYETHQEEPEQPETLYGTDEDLFWGGNIIDEDELRAEREPDAKDIMIEKLEKRLEDEKNWYWFELEKYIEKRQNLVDDPVEDAKHMNLNTGDSRDEVILTLISRIEGERFFYDSDIDRRFREGELQF